MIQGVNTGFAHAGFGKNRAIVAIAWFLVEIIHTMLSGRQEFNDNIDSLTEKKIENMSIRAKNPIRIQQLEATMKQWIAKKYGKDHEWKREQIS